MRTDGIDPWPVRLGVVEMASAAIRNFMKQQGFGEEGEAACDLHFSGLYFQPRIVGPLVVVAILLQSSALFFALSAVLWWNVLLPKWNPFEAAYKRSFARLPQGHPDWCGSSCRRRTRA